jgi:hypothetical protein
MPNLLADAKQANRPGRADFTKEMLKSTVGA